jgi:NADH:ubiquinone oxidoreductase subunit D
LRFSIPVGEYGDCYDRFLIRLEEMRESLFIMEQCLNFLNQLNIAKDFNYLIDDLKIVPPTRGYIKYSMESLIHHFKLYTEGIVIPKEETYCVLKHLKGNLVYFLLL